MQINGINGTGAQSGMMGIGQETDAYSRQLQKQISEAQKKLQDISTDENLSSEEKMKKRQEIQQEINNLNVQLRQHQIELRQEKQREEKSDSDVTELIGGKQNGKSGKGGSQTGAISEMGMSAIISADTAMKQARIQGNTANRMENRAGVLKSEIKMDRGNTEAKEKELAETEKRGETALAAQAGTLKSVGEELKKAGEIGKEEKQEKVSGSEKSKEKNAPGTKDAENEKDDSVQAAEKKQEEDRAENPYSTNYVPVDIRL